MEQDILVAKLRKSVFQATEELKIRRALDKETEEKLHTLISEKHALRSQYDSTVKELQLLKELHANDEIAFEQKHVARVKKLEVENQKLQCSNETMTQELTAFMEEIKTLQLNKYLVEKQLKEQSGQMSLQCESQRAVTERVTQLQAQLKVASQQMQELEVVHTQLKDSVTSYRTLQEKLQRVNAHYRCEVASLGGDVKRLQAELCHVQTQVSTHAQQMEALQSKYEQQIKKLETDLELSSQFSSKLEQQLDCLLSDKEAVQSKLKDSAALVARQADSLSRYTGDNNTLTTKLADVTKQLDDVRSELEDKARRLFVEGEAHKAMVETWKQEENTLRERLTTAEGEFMSTYQKLSELETEKQECDEQIVTLLNQIASLQADLNKPKEDATVQTEVNNADIAAQTDYVTSDIDTQTENDYVTSSTQTLYITTHVTPTQTDAPSHRSVSSQSETDVIHIATQTVQSQLFNVTSQTDSPTMCDVTVQYERCCCEERAMQTLNLGVDAASQTVLANLTSFKAASTTPEAEQSSTADSTANASGDCDRSTRQTQPLQQISNCDVTPRSEFCRSSPMSRRINLPITPGDLPKVAAANASDVTRSLVSPLSRFRASLKSLSLTKSGSRDETSPVKKRRRFRNKEKLQSAPTRTASSGQTEKNETDNKFSFLNLPQGGTSAPSRDATEAEANVTSILQAPPSTDKSPASAGVKRGSKSVRFSSELETHHVIDVSDTTPSVPATLQWNDVNTAYEQFIKRSNSGACDVIVEEVSLFSDDETAAEGTSTDTMKNSS